MSKLQFRVLYREFLFRMVDLELLSSHALGDSNKLLGQFVSLLLFLSVLLTAPAVGFGSGTQVAKVFLPLEFEHFLISTTMRRRRRSRSSASARCCAAGSIG